MSVCVSWRGNITQFVTFYHLIDTVCAIMHVLYFLLCVGGIEDMCCEVVSRCECQDVCRVFSLITVINCCYFRSMALTVCTLLNEEL